MSISKPKHALKIFVGSTYVDLKGYRATARDELHRLEMIVRGMETFGSMDGKPLEECITTVRSCSVYIGIFGMRYGSIPKGKDISMTHIEYEEAQYIKLPSLIYIIDEENQPLLTKNIEMGEGAVKLKKLKEKLKSTHTVSFFTTEEDLATKIGRDLPRLIKKKFTDSLEFGKNEKSTFKVSYIENRENANLDKVICNAQKRIRIIQTNLSTVVSDLLPSIEGALVRATEEHRHLHVSLLTLDPESYFAAVRAKQLNLSVQQFRNEMHKALEEICNRLGSYDNVDIRVYDDFPTQICFMIDNHIYNCTVSKNKQSRYNCLFKFDSQHPALYDSFVSHFTSVWHDKKTTRNYMV